MANIRHGNPNQLQRSSHGNIADIRNLGGLQNLGNLAMHNAPNAIPLSSSYLQPQNCGIPPLPVRRNPMSSFGRMGMGGYYSPYSRYPTNMYTPGYGGYRMSSYGQYGGGGQLETSSFMQMAEESTRPAFESIESVVEVVSSISMMLESTYHAVHSSYSAILGVVDQFSRLKDHLAQMLSILALLRGLRWLCLKFLYLLRLRKENPSEEAAWKFAEMSAGQSNLPPRPDKARGSAWPFLMFVGLVIGAPWLMFKLLSKTLPKKPLDTKTFQDEYGRHVTATTAYDFKATQSDELSFSAGERLYISPASSYRCPQGWLYACNSKQETGLIPSTYLVLHQKNKNAQNARHSFQQASLQNATTRVPNQQFDYSQNPAGNFNSQPINSDYLRNLAQNSNVGSSNLDYSKNPVRNPDARPGNFNHSVNANGKLNAPPDSRNYSENSVGNSNTGEIFNSYPDTNANTWPSNFDCSKNAAGPFNPQQGVPNNSKNPVEPFIPQQGVPDESAENLKSHSDARDYSQNTEDKVNAPPFALDHSKNSAEENKSQPNDKVSEEVAKQQNGNTTD